jgi:hypothetical protein
LTSAEIRKLRLETWVTPGFTLLSKRETMNIETIIELLKTKVEEGHVFWWMETQLALFKGKTALQMIEDGKIQEVYEAFDWAF